MDRIDKLLKNYINSYPELKKYIESNKSKEDLVNSKGTYKEGVPCINPEYVKDLETVLRLATLVEHDSIETLRNVAFDVKLKYGEVNENTKCKN